MKPVSLRLEELESRLAFSVDFQVPQDVVEPMPPPVYMSAEIPTTGMVGRSSSSARDNVGRLISHLLAGSRSNLEFFKNLNGWIYTSLRPYTSGLDTNGSDDPNTILSNMWGACLNRHIVMAEVAKRLGFAVTVVNFSSIPYQGAHHATAIRIDGVWRFFDSTVGIYFSSLSNTNPLSYSSAVANYPNVRIWQASAPIWVGGWSSIRRFNYQLVTENILRWRGNPVVDIERSYFRYSRGAANVARHLRGDFNGDGRTDLLNYDASRRQWWVTLTRADGTLSQSLWGSHSAGVGAKRPIIGDFNGDGRDDIALYRPGAKMWWVGLSTTNNRFSFTRWLTSPQKGLNTGFLVGDFNGDNKDDIAVYQRATGTWLVGASSGSAFTFTEWGKPGPRTGWSKFIRADFNGDGKDDLAMYRVGTGTYWVGLSSGSDFTFARQAGPGARTGWAGIYKGDFDGDGKEDLAMRRGGGNWWVGLSKGDGGFNWSVWAIPNLGAVGSIFLGDFNGDGKTDVLVYRKATRTFWTGFSTGGSLTFVQSSRPVNFNSWSVPLVGDFNRDGADDVAVYRAFNTRWWVDYSPKPRT